MIEAAPKDDELDLDPSVFGPTLASNYWSSSALAIGPDRVWSVLFTNGYVSYNYKSFAVSARAVRGGRQ